ncbi:ABC transporter ATP-binding protein [Paenibacillus thailandensis]|uniref:ABC transporter ATP-binding protein n=1 Tax=Paenibacillus thailandensis TaxID=393250 RepID=A0ABW5QTR8_9BACL
MAYIRKYIRKYGLLFTLSVLLVTGEAFVDLLQPAIMARMVDEGVASKDLDLVMRLGGWMLLITALGAVAAASRNIVSSWVSQNFGAELRQDLFEKVQSLSLANVDRFDKASLVTRMTNDVTQVQNFVNGMMRIFVKAPVLCIGSVIMAFRLNPYLSMVLIAVVPAVGLLIVMNMKIGFPLFIKVQSALDRLNGAMREYLSGVRVVKAFNRFDYEQDKFDRINSQYERRSISAQRIMAAFGPGVTFAINIGIIAVLWIGGIRVDSGHIPVGHIIAFVNYMTQILFSLTTMTMIINMFVRAKASAGRIGEVLRETDRMVATDTPGSADSPDTAISTEKPKPNNGPRSIAFENVSFSYGGTEQEQVLKDISFECRAGKTLAVIGSTGSGKSSLAKLIPRLYDVKSGAVTIGGVDVRNMPPKALRESIAIVPQQTLLFTGTVLDNIRMGKPEATMEEVEQAARLAAAHGFISELPEGYGTVLGQGGVNLSGGQKQRIAIARALVRKPDILILDDCTSALDNTTEAAIKEGIARYAKGITCMMIAQRITSVMDADQILVLDEGRIAGIGSHAELMSRCSVYREIYRSQFGKEAESYA